MAGAARLEPLSGLLRSHRDRWVSGASGRVRGRRAAPGTADVATVTVLLHGRTTTVPVEKDGGSVLDAVLAARADAPYE